MTWILNHGDCLHSVTGMPSLADRSVDHVITDPPYAPIAMKNRRSGSTIKKRRDGQTIDFKYAGLPPWVRWAAAAEFARLAKRWVMVWCDIESAGKWREALGAAGLVYVRTGVWLRELGAPQFSADRPAQDLEAYVLCHQDGVRMRWNGRGKHASVREDLRHYNGPIVNANDGLRIHSSPKPAWLMEAIINDYTEAGETICDPFAGSGATGIAAVRFGRNFIGWELSADYHADASNSLSVTMEQKPLFGDAPPKRRQRRMDLSGAAAGEKTDKTTPDTSFQEVADSVRQRPPVASEKTAAQTGTRILIKGDDGKVLLDTAESSNESATKGA